MKIHELIPRTIIGWRTSQDLAKHQAHKEQFAKAKADTNASQKGVKAREKNARKQKT